MGESRNRVAGAYALTTFAPIIPGHEEELLAYIEGLPTAAASPLARLDTLHLSRIQIFDHLVHQGPKHDLDHLEFNYLVFTSSFDGDLDAYLNLICERIPAKVAWMRRNLPASEPRRASIESAGLAAGCR